MPKQKTVSAARKRFKLTGTGRLLRRPAMKSHNLEKKSAKRRRSFGKDRVVAQPDAEKVRKQLGI